MRGGLYLLADLYQKRWTVRDDARALADVAKEIRAQSAEFGLTPMARRRLQWEIPKEEEAEPVKAPAPRKVKTTARRPAADPRNGLKVVA